MDMMLSVQIRGPNPDDFQNIMGTFLSEDITMIWRKQVFLSCSVE